MSEQPTPTDALEAAEAEVRQLMAAHAAVEVRGFDGAKQRAYLHRQIDTALDLYRILCDKAAVAVLDFDVPPEMQEVESSE